MANTVKRAISLPAAQDSRLQKLARKRRMPYSAVVQAAVQLLLDSESEQELLASYRSYFADKDNADRVAEAVKRFQPSARRAWD